MAMKLVTKISPIVYGQVETIVNKYNLSGLPLAHFLAQCAHESGNFQFTRENLNYSADSLLKVFPKYFKDKISAEKYARKPEAIANKVYASRIGNGDEASGDGYKFRGRGYIQLTGKANYQAFGQYIGQDIVSNPDSVATIYPLESAYWFFDTRKLFDMAKEGDSEDVVKKITRVVNGGFHGLSDRIEKFNFFKDLV
jgi:putative chitinase